MKLVLPTLEFKQSYLEALEESKDEIGETRLNQPAQDQTFEQFVQELNDHSKGKNLPRGYVPATMFWLVDKNEIIGRISIRHELNDFLLQHGGHIGYYIRPSRRQMGYGKRLLGMGLREAKRLGISSALVTCDDDNVGSWKIIEANGGVLENLIDEEDGRLRRYWIDLGNAFAEG